jgi:hypothetical protein
MTDAEIEIVVAAESQTAGEKSLFDATARILAPVPAKTSEIAGNLAVFCQAFSAGIEKATDALTNYQLDKIEMAVELNAKGQVRLIASASTELKGGLKLVFIRKR